MDRCAWPRKVESKISRSSCCKISGQKAMVINNVNYILDSISQANNYTCKVEDDRDYGQNEAARRMKIVVKKQDLKQILDVLMREAVGSIHNKSTRNGHVPPPTTTLEQRLNLMRKRQLLRKASQVVKLRNNNAAAAAAASWRPALQSIPEEEI